MTGLRLGIASPWNTHSAIAQSTSEVAFELVKRGHSVTVLQTETGSAIDLPVRPAPGPIKHISNLSDSQLRRDFDVVIGEIGDNYEFHGALLPRLTAANIVGVFHDMAIPHLIRGWVGDGAMLAKMAKDTYRGTRIADGPFRWDDLSYTARHHPMMEWAASRVVGAVAHGLHYVDRLQHACPGPVMAIPLAFSVPDLPPPPVPWNRLLVAVVGHANTNKRIDQIIYAIGASYVLRECCSIRVIGKVEDRERTRLTRIARHVGVDPPEFVGWVTDDELPRRLRDVDVISCLRNPVFEGASASVILGLLSARPVLVTNHGCYAEIPTEAVLACDPDLEAFHVMVHLERIVRDPAFGVILGQRGRAFAADRHSAAAYVDTLEPLLTRCANSGAVRSTMRELSGSLSEFGIDCDDAAMQRVEAVVRAMTTAPSSCS